MCLCHTLVPVVETQPIKECVKNAERACREPLQSLWCHALQLWQVTGAHTPEAAFSPACVTVETHSRALQSHRGLTGVGERERRGG